MAESVGGHKQLLCYIPREEEEEEEVGFVGVCLCTPAQSQNV